jgi:6-phosphogluconolactonase (cycloisomerase 2 family)
MFVCVTKTRSRRRFHNHLYVCDAGNNRICVFDISQNHDFITMFNTLQSSATRSSVHTLAFDENFTRLWANDYLGSSVLLFRVKHPQNTE